MKTRKQEEFILPDDEEADISLVYNQLIEAGSKRRVAYERKGTHISLTSQAADGLAIKCRFRFLKL